MFCCNTIGNIFRIVIVGGCAFALAMQWLNMFSCDFFHSNETDTTVNVGIWYKGSNDECDLDAFYSEEDFFVKTARSSILLSVLCGAGALIAVLFEWLFCKIPCAGCLEGLAFVGAWACGLGVYMLYLVEACGQVDDLLATNDDMASKIGANIIPDGIPTAMECDWGQGSTYNLLACIAYLGCGILLCFAPKPDPIFK